ncbi:MAG: very short patch repair endonuclease [Methylococcaceae bacterium]|nr:very short patch repair endonuclease [Methylococcaceae bacterium]
MIDTLSKQQRSKAMSKIRSADTMPEWILRCGLHRLGFRYRLRNTHLPGRPDLTFRKYRAAVFVHGCYWHRHPGCKDASTPKSNVDFWIRKFAENVERDLKTKQELEERGWRVTIVWECELTRHTVETIRRIARRIKQGAGCADDLCYHDSEVHRSELLGVAEEKVRYRLASYDEKPEMSGCRATKAKKR